MPRIVPLDGEVVMKGSSTGTKSKWRFRNDTGEPICDFFFKTGPISFLEIEFPWGTSGNPPDVRKVTVRERGFDDGSKDFDDVTEGKVTLSPCIAPGKEFELEFEFDDPFEPDDHLIISPTDRNGVTIESFRPTEPKESNTGVGDLLDAAGKLLGGLKSLTPSVRKDLGLRFDAKRQRYALRLTPAPPRPREVPVAHLARTRIEENWHGPADATRDRKRRRGR